MKNIVRIFGLIVCLVILARMLVMQHPGLLPNNKVFDLKVRGESMTPSKVVVEQGNWVYLNITTDHPVEFQISGIDFKDNVKPLGSTYDASWGIRMDRAGQIRIEDGDTGERLGILIVKR